MHLALPAANSNKNCLQGSSIPAQALRLMPDLPFSAQNAHAKQPKNIMKMPLTLGFHSHLTRHP
jgi:hypothetical protein